MVLPYWSAIKTPPKRSLAPAKGPLKLADSASPSVDAAAPLPASVETTAEEITMERTRFPSLSHTMTLVPAASWKTPVGPTKLAAVPTPSACAGACEPASVLTWPLLTLAARMQRLPQSAT
jgi:hypothetical protein